LVGARVRPPAGAVSTQAPGLHVDGGRIIGVCGDGGVIDVHELRHDTVAVDAATLNAWLQHERNPP
jgi:hypothetical protein